MIRWKTLQGRESELDRVLSPLPRIYVGIKFLGIRGFDTETTKDGDVYLVSCSHRVNRFNSSKAESIFTTDPYIQFSWLLEKGRHTLNVFWNINFDFEGMLKGHLKSIKRKDFLELKMKNKFVIPKQGKGKPLKITFISKKFFKVSDGKHQAYFYDCANFYSKTSLDFASREHLGYGKEKFGVSSKQIDITKGAKELGYETVKKRCETDATLTRLLFERIYSTVMKLGIRPRKWNSPASLSEELLIQKIEEKYLKPFQDNAETRELLEYATRAYKGGIFDLRVKGLCDNITEIDIVSAYPEKIANLPDLVNGKWRRVFDINSDASFGIYHVLRQFDGFSPYFSTKLGKIVYPYTRDLLEDYITAPEVLFLRERGFFVKILDGYEFYHECLEQKEYPFFELVYQLFEIKNKSRESGDLDMYNVSKTIMNAIYGKFVQRNPVLGKLFNPIYGSYITALTRIQITKIAEKYFSEIYEIATDAAIGILKKGTRVEETEKLGGIEIKNRIPKQAVLIQTGLTTNTSGTHFIRNRGLAVRSKSKEIRFTNKSLIIKSVRPRHMRESVIQFDLGVNAINSFQAVEKEINFADRNRIWEVDKPTKKILFSRKIRSRPLGEKDLFALDKVTFVRKESVIGDDFA
jgi:hypothetical protein